MREGINFYYHNFYYYFIINIYILKIFATLYECDETFIKAVAR